MVQIFAMRFDIYRFYMSFSGRSNIAGISKYEIEELVISNESCVCVISPETELLCET